MSVTVRRGDARRRGIAATLLVGASVVAVWAASAPSRDASAAPTAATLDIPVVGGVAGRIPGPATADEPADRLAVVETTPGPADPGPTAPGTSVPPTSPAPADGGTSLRTFGTGAGGVDRVVIPLTASTRANVGATDFTIELWLRGDASTNTASGCRPDADGWINGNIVVDRDVWGGGDRGDFGISVSGGTIAVGVASGASGITICGTTPVLDGGWHHVAVTRRAASGRLVLWVDGRLDGDVTRTAIAGDVSYRIGRATSHPADPTLVLGAEKHDAGSQWPSFTGSIDEVRLSTVVRYEATFGRPSAPFALDASTAALYHFDEGAGTVAGDAAGTSPATLAVGGPAAGPQWQAASPFG